ncbi:heme exporter protein CcmD [Lysobacter sp. D1-1-M9]|uniref:heme exporter protein CcmD n=1 Tax=Novilysobacter longmucuonensis TaxID=3098603 RepID=UPI002FCBA1EB
MSYQNYVIAAYVVFALVLAWEFIVPRLQIRRELRHARRRAARQAARPSPTDMPDAISSELSR